MVGIWILITAILFLSLWFFRSPANDPLKSVKPPEKTPLYAKTEQRIKDFYIDLDRNKLTPWSLFNTGKMPKIKDFYGKSIQYEGVKFKGSPRLIFWEGFIEPFLEHGIIDILEQIAGEAKQMNLPPKPCIDEAVGLLYPVISNVYERMAQIDQKLRGKGEPQSVKLEDVSKRIKKMHGFLRVQQKARTEISYAQKEKWYKDTKFVISTIIAVIMAIIAAIAIVAPIYIHPSKTNQHLIETTNIFAEVSKNGDILQSNNFSWKIKKSINQDGNILYTLVDRRGDATAISVAPDNPEYTVYQSYGGMVIKYTCAEENIPSKFTIKVKY